MSGNKQRRFTDEFKRKAVRLTRRTKSLTAICGGMDFHEHLDMFSRQNTGYDLDAQFSLHTCRIIVRIRSRNAPSSTL
jgi:transposase-like protein